MHLKPLIGQPSEPGSILHQQRQRRAFVWTQPQVPDGLTPEFQSNASSSSRETLYTSTPLNKNLSQGIQAEIEGLRSLREFQFTMVAQLSPSRLDFGYHTQLPYRTANQSLKFYFIL
jgi:hypothetical protein